MKVGTALNETKSIQRAQQDLKLENMNLGLLKALQNKIIYLTKLNDFGEVSPKEAQILCEHKLAYKIKHDFLIGREYLTEYILKETKRRGSCGLTLSIEGAQISPIIVRGVLDALKNKGLVVQETPELYTPNIKCILSQEAIKNFCKYRIDVFTVTDILNGFGFVATQEINIGGREETIESEAFNVCKEVLRELTSKGFLRSDYANSISTNEMAFFVN